VTKEEKDVESIPVTSTGPVDITQLPGYTTCRTGDPANLSNDRDINPPVSPPKVLLAGVGTTAANNLNSNNSSGADSSSTYVTSTNPEAKKIWPPDASRPSIVTPSTPTEYEKPDIGNKI
jgi:hypothetical protein